MILEHTAKIIFTQYLTVLLSLGQGTNWIIIGQKQSVIGESLPLALFLRDDLTKKIYFEMGFKVSLSSKSEWLVSILEEYHGQVSKHFWSWDLCH